MQRSDSEVLTVFEKQQAVQGEGLRQAGAKPNVSGSFGQNTNVRPTQNRNRRLVPIL
jgi:hypothetical protein